MGTGQGNAANHSRKANTCMTAAPWQLPPRRRKPTRLGRHSLSFGYTGASIPYISYFFHDTFLSYTKRRCAVISALCIFILLRNFLRQLFTALRKIPEHLLPLFTHKGVKEHGDCAQRAKYNG